MMIFTPVARIDIIGINTIPSLEIIKGCSQAFIVFRINLKNKSCIIYNPNI